MVFTLAVDKQTLVQVCDSYNIFWEWNRMTKLMFKATGLSIHSIGNIKSIGSHLVYISSSILYNLKNQVKQGLRTFASNHFS